MKYQRIIAVDDVSRQGAIGLAEALRWFYVEVAELEEVDPDEHPAPSSQACTGDSRRTLLPCNPDVGQDPESTLCFRSRQQIVRIDLVANPVIESTGFPIVIAVSSLEKSAELLDARSVAFETISGISWPDRRLSTSDPSGNRVELKREWPYDPL